jgi:hypothetical protein
MRTLRASISAIETATTAKPLASAAPSNPTRMSERAASMMYVTGLNVAAISIGRVS